MDVACLHSKISISFFFRLSDTAAPPMIKFSIKCILSREFSTCNGVIAQKRVGSSIFLSGSNLGSAIVSFNFLNTDRTTIILPEIYSTGRHNNAESPSFRFKKLQVISAELSIRDFSIGNFFGIPVEPEVCTSTVSESENHSSKKFSTFSSKSF